MASTKGKMRHVAGEPSFPSILVETNDDLFGLPEYINKPENEVMNMSTQEDVDMSVNFDEW